MDLANIIRKVAASTNADILNYLSQSDDTLRHIKTSCGLIKFMRDTATPDQVSELIYHMYGDALLDSDILPWLCTQIKKRVSRVRSNLVSWLSRSQGTLKRNLGGRPGLSIEEKQIIYDTALEHSIITVDRRNGRDQMKMSKAEFDLRYKNIDPRENMSIHMVRNRECVMFTKRISTCACRQLVDKIKERGVPASYGGVQK